MAARGRAVSHRRIKSQRQAYVYGNTVRQPEVLPQSMPKTAKEPEKDKRSGSEEP